MVCDPLCLRHQPLDVVLEEHRGGRRPRGGRARRFLALAVRGRVQLAHLEVALARVALQVGIFKQ